MHVLHVIALVVLVYGGIPLLCVGIPAVGDWLNGILWKR